MDTTHGLGPWWWSSGQRACLPTIRVRISLTSTVFPVTFVFEKNENKQKEAGVGPLEKNGTESPSSFRRPLFMSSVTRKNRQKLPKNDFTDTYTKID